MEIQTEKTSKSSVAALWAVSGTVTLLETSHGPQFGFVVCFKGKLLS